MINVRFLPELNQRGMCRQTSEIPEINFHKNPSDGRLLQAARSKDGRTDMIQLIFDFS
jgi:hypothetical protein